MCRLRFVSQLALLTLASLALIIAVCCSLILATRETVVNESRYALESQIANSSISLIGGAARVFEAEMVAGSSAFLLPIANSLRDAHPSSIMHRGAQYPFGPLQSHMNHPGRLKQPVTKNGDDPAVDHPNVGLRRFIEDAISKPASSVFLADQYGVPDGSIFTGMAPNEASAVHHMDYFAREDTAQAVINQTSFMDLYAAPAWQLNPEYLTVYVGAHRDNGGSTSMLRQYPGVVTSPTMCGVALASLEELEQVISSLSGDLRVQHSVIVGEGAQLLGKQIQYVDNTQVKTVADVQQRLDDAKARGAPKVSVTWPAYELAVQDWYKGALHRAGGLDTTMEAIEGVSFSSPEKSPQGLWKMTGSRAIREQSSKPGGLPEDAVDGGLIGVVSFDLYLPSVQHITKRIRTRKTGEAHLFNLESGALISSPQWQARPEDQATNLAELSVGQQSFGSENIDRMRRDPSGAVIFDQSLVVHTHLLGGRFGVVIETPQEEIVAALEQELEQIDEDTESAAIVSIAVCGGCVVMVLFFIFVLARSIVPQLTATEREAKRIVQNLGGDLFAGVDLGGSGKPGLGEVRLLRNGFCNMLQTLASKRKTDLVSEKDLHRNPLVGHAKLSAHVDQYEPLWGSSVSVNGPTKVHSEIMAPAIRVSAPDGKHKVSAPDGKHNDYGAMKKAVPRHQTVFWRMMLLIGLPLVIALGVAGGITGMLVHSNALSWLHPIKATMAEEEQATLQVQLDAVAETLSLTFRRHSVSLSTWKQIVEKVYNSGYGMDHDPLELRGQGVDSPVFPNFVGVESAQLQQLPTWWQYPRDLPGGLHASKRVPGKSYNYWVSGYWRNGKSWRESGYADALQEDIWKNATYTESERILSHLDPFARALYFSNDLTNVQVGLDDTESYRSYPFTDKSSFISWKGKCVRGYKGPRYLGAPRRTGYTPLCRPWYEKARMNQGTITFNTLDVSASTGLLYLALSVGLHDARGQFIGVAAIEASMKQMQETLTGSVLENGYFYLADRSENLLVHPKLAVKEHTQIVMKEFGPDCDGDLSTLEMEQEWMIQKFPFILQSNHGMEEQMKCGQKHWLLWQHVEGTEYIAFLTVPLSDITRKADETQRSIEVQISLSIGLCTGASGAAALLFLVMVAAAASKTVGGLVRLVGDIAHSQNYDVILPGLSMWHSKELTSIITSIRHLLIALRFGNPDCHRGDSTLELQDISDAEKLMRDTGNTRGLGVVLNNKAGVHRRLALESQQSKNQKLRSTELQEAVAIYEEAVQLARNEIEEQDRLGTRLLGLGLTYLDLAEENPAMLEKALACFNEALGILKKAGSWRTLTQLASSLVHHPMTTGAGVGTPCDALVQISRTAANAAAAVLRNSAAQFEVKDGALLAQLCLNLHKEAENPQLLCWALEKLPLLHFATLVQLALYVKGSSGVDLRVLETIDEALAPLYLKACSHTGADWPKGAISGGDEGIKRHVARLLQPRPPKQVIFCLDRTWEPILKVSADAVASICQEHMEPKDIVGLYSLGDGWLSQPSEIRGTKQKKLFDSIAAAGAKVSKVNRYNDVAGQTKIAGVDTDAYGNAKGNCYDLAKDGAYAGSGILVLKLYAGTEFSTKSFTDALAVKGFEVTVWHAPGTPEELRKQLENPNMTQLWVISGATAPAGALSPAHVQVIKEFFDEGLGVYIWGDNEPYLREANTLGNALLGVGMVGNVPGGKVVKERPKEKRGPGFEQHLITTGLEYIFEGITIATITGKGKECNSNSNTLPSNMVPLIYGSAGNLVTAVYEEGNKRCIFDGGFTRLYCNWDTAGTGRYVVNAAAWLAEGRLSSGQSCRLYPSIDACLSRLHPIIHSGGKKMDQWLIVLTDLVDLTNPTPQGVARAGEKIATRLKGISDLNFAVIDSSAISGWEPSDARWPAFRENLTKFLNATGDKGHHLVAEDEAAVLRAFNQVAEMMDVAPSLSEAL